MKSPGICCLLSRLARLATFWGAAAVLLAACSAPQKATVKTIFFPSPPDEPRLQYLTSISNSKFTQEGKSAFRLIITGEQEKDTELTIDKPLGIAVHKGVVYVVDTHRATVLLIDTAKNLFETIRGNVGPGRLKKPVNLTIGEDGKLYVADVGRKEVLIYTAGGDFIRAVGKGLDLKKPVGVEVDQTSIYVLDNASNTIKVIDKATLELTREFGQGTSEDDSLWRPYAIARDAKGALYVTNTGTGKVLKMDSDGHTLLAFGKLGDGLGQFARPRGLTVDSEGRIWVVDAAFQNVQIFNETGRLLLFFGDPGQPPASMNIPASVAVTREKIDYFMKFADPSFEVEQLVFVTNQSGYDMLTVYGFGHAKQASEKQPVPASSSPAAPAAPPASGKE